MIRPSFLKMDFTLFFVYLAGIFIQSHCATVTAPKNLTWKDILPTSCGLVQQKLIIELNEQKFDKSMNKVFNGESTTIDFHPWQVRVQEIENRFSALMGDHHRAKRVVNGKERRIEFHPWQAALATRERDLKCSGSIISHYHVLTAAHCFVEDDIYRVGDEWYNSSKPVSRQDRIVLVGNTGFKESDNEYNIEQLYYHGYYSRRTNRNDIALLKIEGKFEWNRHIFPICLPTADYTPGNERCIISGHGANHEENRNKLGLLNFGEVQITSREECKKNYTLKSTVITEGMFCATGLSAEDEIVDTCKGDSGGPLYCENKTRPGQSLLIGITSFGNGCGREGFPGIYTNVSMYLEWIYDRLEVSLGRGSRLDLPKEIDVGRTPFLSEV